MKFIYCFVFIALSLFACGSSKSTATPAEIENLKKMVEQRAFEIESDYAYPVTTTALMSLQNAGLFLDGSNASSVSLIGNPNYLRVKGDSVFAELPYFGEVQMPSYPSRDNGIHFKTLLEDYEANQNEKSKAYDLKFGANGTDESYNVFITLFPNGRSSIRISGSKRNSIEYTGEVKKWSREKD
ncbi:DUF4251 domain-containing protein [Subsaximicrobium wynnwilliamsii]|uniref:DUF4251 domain-containing protein n=1 Tax=Subsaximicrobium wynnwilliamsii TaxID=291179 RepID=A0A5C6ZHT9_9FLAO|nr:DUF4251 domain-containing protein [Subsaximicrobium wynnwilliamsii]TXD84058.1 DUF4251 domain-containing protein [Subsaximicrobium wynnwilliamsii]TXD88984.1 DUF4251 domain-containing protein [Subsaximicrobium wynnwilliamsii]TXE03770.1 DUF4251 domain-containing protein [Subsaximicrobium wynnwilliamsii]